MTRISVVTCRIQFNISFDFQAARDIVPYLSVFTWLTPDAGYECAPISYVEEILREENQFPENFGVSKECLPLWGISIPHTG